MKEPRPVGDGAVDMTDVMLLVHRCRTTAADRMNEALAPWRINATQALVLENLLDLRETSAAELARRCSVTRQALTAPVNALERRGLISRPDTVTADRIRPIRLTSDGREVARAARTAIRDLQSRAAAGISPADLGALAAGLSLLVDGWERIGGSPALGDSAEGPSQVGDETIRRRRDEPTPRRVVSTD